MSSGSVSSGSATPSRALQSRVRGSRAREGQRGLPAAWKKGRALAAAATAFLIGAFLALGRDASRADGLDAWWLRARFSLHERFGSRPSRAARAPEAPRGVAIVALDERSVRAWPEPILFWSPRLARAVDNLTRDGARVIAFDWIQSTPMRQVVRGNGPGSAAARALFNSYDQELGQALGRARSVVMVKKYLDAGNDWLRPTPELLYSLPNAFGREEEFLGYANFSSRDGIIAAQDLVLLDPGKNRIVETSFAARIVERALQGRWRYDDNFLVLESRARGATKPLRRVPLRLDHSLLINYVPPMDVPPTRQQAKAGRTASVGGSGAFTQASLFDVARGDFPKGAFRDRVVLIGATYADSNDLHYIPVLEKGEWSRPRLIPGVEVQAHLVQTLLNASPIREPSAWARWALAMALSAFALACFAMLPWGRASLLAGGAALLWVAASAWAFVSAGWALPVALPLAGMLASTLAMGGYRVVGEERQRQQVLGLWGRYQHPRIVEYLLRHPEARGGNGQAAQVTVLFADLKNFTKTVEHLSPDDAIKMLNRYLSVMVEVIDEYDGIVDKFLGDGLLAQWGAPFPWDQDHLIKHHSEAAVRACLAMMERTDELTRSLQEETSTGAGALSKDVTFGLRLTLHTGPVTVGWVGAHDEKSRGRIEYTIIGDTVNVCSRLQETAKALDCEFLVSESTYQAAKGIIEPGRTSEVEIRGRIQPLRVFEVLGLRAPDTASSAREDAAE
jgi:adenylate cyclase